MHRYLMLMNHVSGRADMDVVLIRLVGDLLCVFIRLYQEV